MKSAIDWGLVTRAKKAQEKLARYFELLEEVRSLEADPDVAAFLASGEMEAPEQPTENTQSEAGATDLPQGDDVIPSGNSAVQAAEIPKSPVASSEETERTPRVPRSFIKRTLHKVGTEDFDAPEVLSKFRELYLPHYSYYGSVDARQVNDHLRRMERDGELEKTEEGRRGRKGSFPRYRMVERAAATTP